jgi:S-adenosylmethionine:tRNA ribosyltransferase-isomerase
MSELDAYHYDLPERLVAQQPLANRVDARLMLVNRQTQSWEHHYIRDLPELLSPANCLVLNDTRVIPARLLGYRTSTGGRWEGLFLSADDHGTWKVLSKTRGKLSPGETITVHDVVTGAPIELRLLLRAEDGSWILHPLASEAPMALLERIGRVPLPHYIREGEMLPSDRERYQTVYARDPGAVAAPTAGLHFTSEMLERLQQRGQPIAYVTLHVGLGTFRPITAERLADHAMHSEWGRIGDEAVSTIRAAKAAGGRVVAVGSTSLRVLETAARNGALAAWEGETSLFIRPPYEFEAVDALLTNFHLPRTTLMVLVGAFAGNDLIRRAYAAAIADEYRFYSYGDAMLII